MVAKTFALKLATAKRVIREKGMKALLLHIYKKYIVSKLATLSYLSLLFFTPYFPNDEKKKILRIPVLQNRDEFDSFLQFILSYDKNVGCKNILEIGTFKGGSAILLKKHLNANITTIDFSIPLCLRFVFKLKRINYVIGNSQDPATVEKLSGKTFDVVFIDGDHTFKGVSKDYELYSRLVKSKGLIVFHDIAFNHPDVAYFWQRLSGAKIEFVSKTPRPFGGIGVLLKP